MNNIKINNFEINDSSSTYIIAELSANHNGNLQNALDTIKAAKEIGADAVKIQTYTADTITLNSKKKDFMIDGGTLWDGKNLYELYEEAHTPWEWHKELFDYAKKINIDIFSSPFDKTAVDFLHNFNPPAYKIASFEITDYELVRYTASKSKPIIISTGVGTKEEIEDVVKICKKEGNNNIILLKCTSAYPAPLEDANLMTIPDLAETFDVVVGFSDHTLGSTAAVSAVTLGAKVIEKHFILDKSLGGPDVEFSADVNEFRQYIVDIRNAEKALGSHEVTISNKIKIQKENFGRKLFFVNSKDRNEEITEADIKSLRGGGAAIHTKYYKDIIGATTAEGVQVGDPVIWENIIKKEN